MLPASRVESEEAAVAAVFRPELPSGRAGSKGLRSSQAFVFKPRWGKEGDRTQKSEVSLNTILASCISLGSGVKDLRN